MYGFMELSSSLEADSRSAGHEITLPFMQPEGLLLCSHESATGSYPEPPESTPLPSYFFNICVNTTGATVLHAYTVFLFFTPLINLSPLEVFLEAA
jgi:hypothetical protein